MKRFFTTLVFTLLLIVLNGQMRPIQPILFDNIEPIWSKMIVDDEVDDLFNSGVNYNNEVSVFASGQAPIIKGDHAIFHFDLYVKFYNQNNQLVQNDLYGGYLVKVDLHTGEEQWHTYFPDSKDAHQEIGNHVRLDDNGNILVTGQRRVNPRGVYEEVFGIKPLFLIYDGNLRISKRLYDFDTGELMEHQYPPTEDSLAFVSFFAPAAGAPLNIKLFSNSKGETRLFVKDNRDSINKLSLSILLNEQLRPIEIDTFFRFNEGDHAPSIVSDKYFFYLERGDKESEFGRVFYLDHEMNVVEVIDLQNYIDEDYSHNELSTLVRLGFDVDESFVVYVLNNEDPNNPTYKVYHISKDGELLEKLDLYNPLRDEHFGIRAMIRTKENRLLLTYSSGAKTQGGGTTEILMSDGQGNWETLYTMEVSDSLMTFSPRYLSITQDSNLLMTGVWESVYYDAFNNGYYRDFESSAQSILYLDGHQIGLSSTNTNEALVESPDLFWTANPVSGNIEVNFNTMLTGELMVYNMEGGLIHHTELKNKTNHKIKSETLPAGQYLIKVQTEMSYQTKKITIF